MNPSFGKCDLKNCRGRRSQNVDTKVIFEAKTPVFTASFQTSTSESRGPCLGPSPIGFLKFSNRT